MCCVCVVTSLAGKCGWPGDVDGPADEALLSDVLDVQCLSNCSVLVTEPGAGRIRLIQDPSQPCLPAEPKGILALLLPRFLKAYSHMLGCGLSVQLLPGVDVSRL